MQHGAIRSEKLNGGVFSVRVFARSGEEVLDEIAAEEAKLDAEEAAIKGSSASRLESEQRMYELNERRRELRERRAARGQSQEEPSSGKSSSRKRKRERTKEEALKDLLVSSWSFNFVVIMTRRLRSARARR